MAKKGIDIVADVENGRAFSHMMMNLESTFTTNQHINAATKAGYSLLAQAFGQETDAIAAINPDQFTHVYEWGSVGLSQARLFEVQLEGRDARRSITWSWRPSKTYVPIEEDEYPSNFDTSRLNRTHIFIWKAPIIEYGQDVMVRRKTSKVLVIPNPEQYSSLGKGRVISDGSASVLITPNPYSFSPGRKADVVGNFTAWFYAWWGGGRANAILSEVFEPQRDNAFKAAFRARTTGLRTYKSNTKTASATLSSQAPQQGYRMAQQIAKDVELKYRQMTRSAG